MKHFLKFNFILFFFFHLNGQVEHVKIKSENNPLIPNISGYTQGDIPYYLLCDSLGIQSSGSYKVKEFNVSYRGEEFNIKGNLVPDSICVYIGTCKYGQIIFFTEIFAEDAKSNLIKMYPFNLSVIKDED